MTYDVGFTPSFNAPHDYDANVNQAQECPQIVHVPYH